MTGLLIKENEVIAGNSAKKAATKIETVKKALFNDEEDANEIKRTFRKYKVDSLLILGTSDGMIEKIMKNLGLTDLVETIYIQDVATSLEMEEAKRIRQTEGKHVIPVPTFEIKKDFSGYLLDPLQIFKFKGKNVKPYVAEKSIIRPTFSYLGNYTISDSVLREIIEHLAYKTEAIHKVNKVRVENTGTGVQFFVEVTIVYGFNLFQSLKDFKKKCKKEVETLTAMNVEKISVIAKEIYVND